MCGSDPQSVFILSAVVVASAEVCGMGDMTKPCERLL